MNGQEYLDLLKARYSVRSFSDVQLTDAELDVLLQAAQLSPTAKNSQPFRLCVVQSAEGLAKIDEATRCRYGAPTVIVVLAKADSRFIREDGSLVMGNLMNAAHALGLGSCWIHRAREVFESDEGKALLKKWGVEGDYVGVGNCILGYAAEEPAMKPRKDDFVYYVL